MRILFSRLDSDETDNDSGDVPYLVSFERELHVTDGNNSREVPRKAEHLSSLVRDHHLSSTLRSHQDMPGMSSLSCLEQSWFLVPFLLSPHRCVDTTGDLVTPGVI